MPKGIYESEKRHNPHPNKRVAQPSHSGIHQWLCRNYPKSGICEHCDQEKRTHYAAKSHDNYTRDRADYLELCAKCHADYDGRVPPSQAGKKISPEHIAALQAGRRRARALKGAA